MDERIAKLRTPLDVLEFALMKEKEARDFYDALLSHSTAAVLREFAVQLKDEEHRHVRMIEKKLAELRMGRGLK